MVPVVSMMSGVFFGYPWFQSKTDVLSANGASCKSLQEAVGGDTYGHVSHDGKIVCWVHESYLHDVAHVGSTNAAATEEYSNEHLFVSTCRGCQRVTARQQKSKQARIKRGCLKRKQFNSSSSSSSSSSCSNPAVGSVSSCSSSSDEQQERIRIYNDLVAECGSRNKKPRYQDLWEAAGLVAFERKGKKRKSTMH